MSDVIDWSAPDDSGSSTQRRYEYQADVAAQVCLEMLQGLPALEVLQGLPVAHITCEHFEDFVVARRRSGGELSWHFHQVKTRDETTPWKLSDVIAKKALKSLWRSHQDLRDKDLDYELLACLEGQLDLREAEMSALASGNGGRHPECLKRVAQHLGTTDSAAAAEFLARVRVTELPRRTDLAMKNLTVLWELGPAQTMTQASDLREQLRGLITKAMQGTLGPGWVDQLIFRTDLSSDLRRKRIDVSALAHIQHALTSAAPLIPWSVWCQQAPLQTTPLAAATVACFTEPAIRRPVDDWLADEVDVWLRNDERRSHALVLEGARGRGSTWALLRSAERLHRIEGETPLFVLDTFPSLRTDKLREAMAVQRRPSILVIDGADAADAQAVLGHLILNGPGAPCLYLISTRDADSWRRSRLSGQVRIKTLEQLTSGEIADMASALRPGSPELTHGERMEVAQYRRSNSMHADRIARLLSHDSKERFEEYEKGLYSLYGDIRNSEQFNAGRSSGILFLLYCGSFRLTVPASLLYRAFSLTPTELDAHLQRFPTFNGDLYVWMEQPSSLVRVIQTIRDSMGSQALDDLRYEAYRSALKSVNMKSAAHVDFSRRLFAKMSPRDQRRLVREESDLLLSLVKATARSKDLPAMLVYSWYPLLLATHSPAQGEEDGSLSPLLHWDSFGDIGATPEPRSPADVLMMTLYLGNAGASSEVARLLSQASTWDIDPWVKFIELVEKCPGKQSVTEKLLPLLRSNALDFYSLLRTSNTAQLLPPVILKFGGPDEQLWLWQNIVRLVDPSGGQSDGIRHKCSRHLRELTSRCSMHKRHDLSLRILSFCVSSDHIDDDLYRVFQREFFDLQRYYADQDLGQRAVSALYSLTDRFGPSRAQFAWSSLLRIAVRWCPEEAGRLSREALDEVDKHLRGNVPPAHYQQLRYSALETAIHTGALKARDVANFLALFSLTSREDQYQGVARLAAAGAVAADADLRAASQQFLADWANGTPRDAGTVFQGYPSFLADWSGGISPKMSSSGMLSLPTLKCLVNGQRLTLGSSKQHQTRALRIRRNYAQMTQGELFAPIMSELLRSYLPEEARVLLSQRSRRDAQFWCTQAQIEALEGDFRSARRSVQKMLSAYEVQGAGAHPGAVRDLALKMAASETGNTQRAWSLVAHLQKFAPLDGSEFAGT
ncbi:dsDNA nuclease domain-containing protein [Streptomyces sp. R21]|uniref:DsDNA nuclease domain-containing protein n=1 Tax=Streptomyces sp. R21 TaxID=3238627 RepID=A0AB39PJT2_9ACTN